MTHSFLRPLARTWLSLLLLNVPVLAQTPGTGAIQGTVYDPSGRTVAKASVSIQNDATRFSRVAMTGSDGIFVAPLLVPGSYSLAVKVEGFDEKDAHAVPVIVSETSTVEFHLALAKMGETVEVTADTEMAQTQSSSLGRAVDQQFIEALPPSNRNYTQILSLSPGVVVRGAASSTRRCWPAQATLLTGRHSTQSSMSCSVRPIKVSHLVPTAAPAPTTPTTTRCRAV